MFRAAIVGTGGIAAAHARAIAAHGGRVRLAAAMDVDRHTPTSRRPIAPSSISRRRCVAPGPKRHWTTLLVNVPVHRSASSMRSRSAATGRALRRGEIAPGDPFHEHVAGMELAR